MNLHGWDTVSVASVERVNVALAERRGELVSAFDFEQRGLRLRGRFGPWRILPGAAGAFLNVELPLEEARAKGLPGHPGEQALDGVSVVVQVALKLLPTPDGSGRELRFDLRGDAANAAPVTATQVRDPEGRLARTGELGRSLVGETVAACLAAHAGAVSYVFARFGSVGGDAGWLAPAESDWCHARTGRGDAYLALLGVAPPGSAKDLVRAVDPEALEDAPGGLLAVSRALVMRAAVLPHIRKSFFGPMQPHCSGARIVAGRPQRLPRQKRGPFFANPVLDRLVLTLERGALAVTCTGHADMSMHVRMDFRVDLRMPFRFDADRRVARLEPDPSPRIRHTTRLPDVLDALAGWLIRWIVSLFSEQIEAPIRATAASLQGATSPPLEVTGWVGVPFSVGTAKLADGLVLRDTRRIEGETT